MFKIIAEDKSTKARCGTLTAAHGEIKTPTFMPVGTLATVKGLSPRELCDSNVQAILSNTYHLYLRPGTKVIKEAGGLHKFMSWHKPIITDSGGFQVFSLAKFRKVRDEGVQFKSHVDGSMHLFTPEKVIEIQLDLGSDIIVPLDECLPFPVEKKYAEDSFKRTTEWARRSKKHLANVKKTSDFEPKLLFGIVQGATYPDLRKRAALELLEIEFDGYCLGGLSVGEPLSLAYDIVQATVEYIDREKPRYLMGVGMPKDLVESIERGVDLFDCVLPTRLGRNGAAFTNYGKINLRNAKFISDYRPIEDGCDCYACLHFDRAYFRHLFIVKEMIASRLVSLHNIHFYANLMKNIREAINRGRFKEFKREFLSKYEAT